MTRSLEPSPDPGDLQSELHELRDLLSRAQAADQADPNNQIAASIFSELIARRETALFGGMSDG